MWSRFGVVSCSNSSRSGARLSANFSISLNLHLSEGGQSFKIQINIAKCKLTFQNSLSLPFPNLPSLKSFPNLPLFFNSQYNTCLQRFLLLLFLPPATFTLSLFLITHTFRKVHFNFSFVYACVWHTHGNYYYKQLWVTKPGFREPNLTLLEEKQQAHLAAKSHPQFLWLQTKNKQTKNSK